MSIPIRTYEEHQAAVREIEHLCGAEEGTPEATRLNERTALAEAYRNERRAIKSRIPNDETRQAMAEGSAILHARRKLEIDFEHAGRKRVLDSFVSLG